MALYSRNAVGSVERSTQEMYILPKNGDGENEIIEKEITYTPGLYKIFDEILNVALGVLESNKKKVQNSHQACLT